MQVGRATCEPPLAPGVKVLAESLVAFARAHVGARLRDAWVFGSYARGEAHEDSDLDVCLVIDALAPMERRAILDHSSDLSLGGGIVVSATLLDAAEFDAHRGAGRPLVRAIEAEGVRL